MKIINIFLLFFVLISNFQLNCNETFIVPKRFVWPQIPVVPANRPGSYPWICGDTFRIFCDHIIDETLIPFDPSIVQPADTIFVNLNYIDFFLLIVHPKISVPYILVTHNSIHKAPGKFEQFIDDPKIIAWFGKNTSLKHSKLHPLPLGIMNKHWPAGKASIIESVRSKIGTYNKNKLLYINFDLKTNKERVDIVQLFEGKSWTHKAERKPFNEYLQDLAESKFVLSPEGTSIDCHRTWEAMLVGSIPVVVHSTIDAVFEGLPVLLVDSFEQVTEEFLNSKYQEMSQKKYQEERLFADYWRNKIFAFQEDYRHAHES